MLNNKSVLITGGTGSFGKKITKAILNNKPINVFNHGNMFTPVKYKVNFTGTVPWNAKHLPLGVRDFTYVDDIVEGVKRVINNYHRWCGFEIRTSASPGEIN